MKTIASTFLAVSLLTPAGPAVAQSVWIGATDANWSTGTNWSVPPVSSNTLAVLFTVPSAITTTTVDANYTLNSLVMGSAASYTLGGLLGSLSFNGTNPQLTVQGPGHVIATLVLLAAPTTFVMGDSILMGDVSGGPLTVNGGPGILTLAGTTIPGATTVDAPATLRLGNGAAGPIGATASIVVNGTLETNGGFTGFVNNVTGSGSVHAIGGPGTLNFMDHTGTTTVDLGADLDGSINNSALLTVNGNLFTNSSSVGSLTGTASGTIQVNGTLTLGSDNTNATYLGAVLGGGGGVTKVGSGRQVLAQQLTYSGPTLVSAGTLAIGNGTLGTTGVLFAPTTNAALEIDALGGMNLPDGLTGTGTLTILSGVTTSPLVLTHAGATTVNAGAELDAAINNNALLTVNGTFHATGGGTTVGSLSGAGAAHVFIDSPTLTLGGDNTNQVYAGIDLGGAGGLVKNGSGSQTIAVTGMYFGNTTINGGTLRFGNGAVGPGFVFSTITDNGAIEFNTPGAVGVNPFGGSGTVRVVSGTLNTNGTLTHAGTTTIDAGGSLTGAVNNNALLTVNGTANLGPQPTTAGSLTGSGVVNINAGTFTVGGDNTSTTYSGTFGIGGNTLVKVGTGTLTLTGNSAGVVATSNVNAGTLLVNGQHIASSTTVASGATLGGSGRLGPVFVSAGGFLSPGNSPGLLTTASLFLAGTLLQQIQGNARGTQYDAIDANGAVNLTGATLTISGAYVPVVGDTFTIIANDGVDPVTGTFAGLAQGTTFNFNGRPLTISYTGGTGNDVVLAALAPAPAAGAAPVPSNSDWMLALLAATLLASGIAATRRKLRRAR